MTVLRSGSATHVGRVRTVNEDRALESLTLFAVADGMGGHAGGEIAARLAIDTLTGEFGRNPSADGLVDAVHEANRVVWEHGHTDAALRGMGTTLIAAALVATDDGDRLVVANVGDSRAYRLHGHELVQLTTDHSVAEELVARGELSEAQAAVHPHRHILTRALGVAAQVDVDVWEMVPEEGDRFLLCSDGLSNEVSPERIGELVAQVRSPQEVAESLVRLANEAGGSDNITAVVLDVVVGDVTEHDGAASPVASATTAVATASGGPGHSTAVPEGGVAGAATSVAVADALSPTTTVVPGTGGLANGTGSVIVGRSAGPQATRSSPRDQQLRRRIPRRITLRVVLFLVVLGGLVYGGYAAVHWYVYDSYFVGFDHDRVVIYQGRPGGFVGIEPKVAYRSQMTLSQVPSIQVANLRTGVQVSSLENAHNYISQLKATVCSEENPPSYCPSATAPQPLGTTASTVALGTSSVTPAPGGSSR
ncbi:MAG TPA: Stp1/IreP family PP2C-type Ser/Thr phosphatase [Acidimicrobiales bacterium]|nr:Stp1/IreP family PP2C-type Ser/Thr phosphatase [Acidimicrobiales bacterium]